MKPIFLTLLTFFTFLSAPAQKNQAADAVWREYDQTFLTYPFGDPNPVAKTGKIYPYYRFDGFTTKASPKNWKIVELENEWIRVLIAPEMGGKVLGAFEKSTGHDFIYFNKVVKFRDIAMRGAWTSGGIEFNFGSIGHAPTTGTPVDYLVKTNPDGSVSCWVGAMDLSSRTEWRVEIRVPRDKAWFETHMFWYNPADLSTSRYHWANASADAPEDLVYIFPGDHYIGHEGDASPWPVLPDGRKISNYRENNFNADHSYHVLGTYTDFFAGFYPSDNFGFGHWNDYLEKPGKKIWIWALSPQGAIWTDLLTDQPGNIQYTEIQTGLLFNQESPGSTYTPFKHMAFPSHSCERFSEYWFPVVGTGGVTEVTEAGVLHIDRIRITDDGRKTTDGGREATDVIRFSPLEFIKDTLFIEFSDGSQDKKFLNLKPLELFTYLSRANSQQSSAGIRHLSSVKIGDHFVWSPAEQAARDLDRPVESPVFDWNTVQGLYIKAIEFSRQREYSQARDLFRQCLARDPRYIPALTGLAEEYMRILKPHLAEELLQTALGIDTYDPKANYLYGIVKKTMGLEILWEERSEKSGKSKKNGIRIEGISEFYQAREAFGIAVRSMEYRSAAYTQIAEIAMVEGKLDGVLKYAGKAQDYNRFNIKAMEMEVIAHRQLGAQPQARMAIADLLEIDPLNHFARFENYVLDPTETNRLEFKNLIRNEFPYQTLLELGIFYHNLGRYEESRQVFDLAPDVQEVFYWRHYVAEKPLDSSSLLTPSTKFVLPWRPETLRVIEQAESVQPDWRNRYYMGLIRWNVEDSLKARQLFRSCKDDPAESHFYLARARLCEKSDPQLVQHDLEMAINLEPGEWRTWHEMTGHYMRKRAWAQALDNARRGSQTIPGHMILEFDRAKAELYNHQYDNCIEILNNLIILPAEGAREGHEIYRSAMILKALESFQAQRYLKAIKELEDARKWPENLGVGKPYITDERIEDYLTGLCYLQMNRPVEALDFFGKLSEWTAAHKPAWDSPYALTALSLVLMNRESNGDKILNDWMKVQPASALMMWSVAVYSNDRAAAEKALTRMGWKPEETPWGLGDWQLVLVHEIISKVEIK